MKIQFILIAQLFMFANSFCQKNNLSIEFGLGTNLLNSKATSKELSLHYFGGISKTHFITNNIYTLFEIDYMFVDQKTFLSKFYDPMFKETISFNTSFKQSQIVCPLMIGIKYKSVLISLGCSFKWLIGSTLTMDPVGIYKPSTMVNLNGKYKCNNLDRTSPFNDFNYAPTLRIEVPVLKHLKIGYQFSYDLEINPKYYYFNDYNTFYNSILLNLNL